VEKRFASRQAHADRPKEFESLRQHGLKDGEIERPHRRDIIPDAVGAAEVAVLCDGEAEEHAR
jgi:hypothetical protein